jgi:tRNA threonylcarbamoyladenosine modification (KEOPS) complex  Pcc1 subunit
MNESGLQITEADLNNKVGGAFRDIFNGFEAIKRAKADLDRFPDADLIQLGFSEEGVANMKSAVNVWMNLIAIAAGQATLDVATDFWTFPNRLRGLS